MGDGLFKRGHIWFAWVNGHRVSTGLRDKQAAAKKRDELERRAVDPAYALAREATGQQILDLYAASRRRLGRSPGTMHHLRTKAGNLLALMPHKLDDWNLLESEKYVDTRLKDGVRRTTVKKELRVALAALRHARKHHLFDRAPEDIIPELGDDYRPRTRFLTPWELVALVTALDEENDPLRAAHVVFIVATGARWSESLKAAPSDVGWLSGHETAMHGTKTRAAVRTVPTVGVSASLLSFVATRVRGGMPNRPMFAPWPNVRRSLLSACKRAGIAPVSPNDLRRTFSTWLQQAGATNDLIAKVMGHTSSRMVERVYGKLPAADVARLLRERVGGGLSDEGKPNETDSGTNRSLHEPGGSGRDLPAGDPPGADYEGDLLAAPGGEPEGRRGVELSGEPSGVLRDGRLLDEERRIQDGSAGERSGSGPLGMARQGVKNTGLLMGSKQVFSGRSEGISVITEKAVSTEKNQAFGSAQRQNRTADTGIFNPPESAANYDEFELFGEPRVANGATPELPPGTCPECGGAGLRVYGDGGGESGRATETGWTEECPVCTGEGIVVQGPCPACPIPWGLHTSSMKRRCRGDDPPLGGEEKRGRIPLLADYDGQGVYVRIADTLQVTCEPPSGMAHTTALAVEAYWRGEFASR